LCSEQITQAQDKSRSLPQHLLDLGFLADIPWQGKTCKFIALSKHIKKKYEVMAKPQSFHLPPLLPELHSPLCITFLVIGLTNAYWKPSMINREHNP